MSTFFIEGEMIYFLRTLLIPIIIIFLIYISCNMRILRKVDEQVLDDILEAKGFLSWGDPIKLPDAKERKEMLLEAVAKSKNIKHKKIASFVVKCRGFIHVLFGIFLGLFIYLIIKVFF